MAPARRPRTATQTNVALLAATLAILLGLSTPAFAAPLDAVAAPDAAAGLGVVDALPQPDSAHPAAPSDHASAAPDVVRVPEAPDVQDVRNDHDANDVDDVLDAQEVPGAVYTDQDLSGIQTVWGHDDNAAGVSRISREKLARLDLLQALRDHTQSASCRQALDIVLSAREQLKLWALKMHTASTGLPDAILSGTLYNLGDYDGCLSIPGSMYCLLDAEVRPAASPSMTPARAQLHAGDEVSPYDVPNGVNGTLWDWLKISGNRRRYRRDFQQWAVCVPAACGRADDGYLAGQLGGRPGAQIDGRRLGATVANAVAQTGRGLGVELRLHLSAADCAVNEEVEPEGLAALPLPLQLLLTQPLFLIGSLYIVSFPLLAIIATLRKFALHYMTSADDGWQTGPPKRQGLLATVMDCFAAQGNWSHLKRKQKSQIHAIQGMRTMTMLFVILGHRALNIFGGPVLNPEYVEDSFTEVFKMYIINGNIIVSTFFVISGFLEARLFLNTLKKSEKRFNFMVILQHYIHRYFRIVPALTVILAIEVLWVEHMGSGPVWNQLVGRATQDCKNYWWAHLLFVNNYVNPESLCLLQTWFLAADMQLYLAAPLIMWLVFRLTRSAAWKGLALLGALLVATMTVHYATTVLYDLHPMVHTYPQVLRRQNVLVDPTFTHQYVATHTNAVPYVVGLAVGTLFFEASRRNWSPAPWVRTALWVGVPAGHLLHTLVFFSGLVFFVPSFVAHPLLDALYGPARMLLFSLPTAWIIFTCSMGFGGVFEWLLTWTPFVALGRLTYCVFLVHITFINVTASYMRQPEFLSNFSVTRNVFSDVLASFLLGLALHLAVEAPMASLQKIVINYTIRRADKQYHKRNSAEGQNQTPTVTEETSSDLPERGVHQCPTISSSKL